MSKFMSSEEFSEWAERHTPAEVEEKAIEQQAMLREELLESAGTDLDAYQRAPRDERVMMEQRGGEVWLHEDQQREAAEIAADSDAQDAVLREFCSRHPNRFPCEANGNLLRDEYVAAWQESNPGLPIFWEINALETLFQALESQHAFAVERVYKS